VSEGAIRRTQYRNPVTGTVRTGATGHGESLTDVEEHLLPVDRWRTAALHAWGVAHGLAVTATAGSTGLAVGAGTAVDASGRTVVLAPGGTAVVDQAVDPDRVQDVPTVAVGPQGVTVPTGDASGDVVLTIAWREVGGQSSLANAPVLLHAPWLRLLPAAGFADTGNQVVLAQASLDGTGAVEALTAGLRRLTGAPLGRLELRAPRTTGGPTPTVDQVPVAAVAADEDGLHVDLLGEGAPRRLLDWDAASGLLRLDPALVVASPLRLSSPGGRVHEVSSRDDGSWRLSDAATERLVVDERGHLGLGLAGGEPRTALHVEGEEVHSGGPGGGFSFADRAAGGDYVADPAAGERWRWYSSGGAARLWSGTDRLTVSASGEGGGLDVGRRMRVRQGGDGSAGIWFHQDSAGDRAFVGMLDDGTVGFWGVAGTGWGLQMDVEEGIVTVPGLLVASGAVVHGNLHVAGRISKGGGGFRIDHPLDPDRRWLSHSFVESPDMLTVYAGTATTDERCRAVVTLPPYFDALNSGPCVQVTPVGELAVVAVEGSVVDGAFAILSDRPGVRVHWQVTGVRQDAWARQNRIPVEEDKPVREDGST
jgi:hypothetical protein